MTDARNLAPMSVRKINEGRVGPLNGDCDCDTERRQRVTSIGAAPDTTVVFSIIIPAYDEEAWLPATLGSVREAMEAVGLRGEVIVVDNNSTDKTAQVARDYGASVVFEPVNQISRARNTGAKLARGRFLIFLDADTKLSPELLQLGLNNLSGGLYCGGGAVVSFDKPVPLFARMFSGLWNLISVKFELAAGCFLYCLREGFEATGGFSENVYASEEVWFSRQIRSWGRQRGMAFGVSVDPQVVTSNRKLEWFSPLHTMLILSLFVVFPFAVRFRSLCSYWYSRRVMK